MDTMTLEAALQSAAQQMGMAASHWLSVIAVMAAVLLSAAWMAAGLSRTPREI